MQSADDFLKNKTYFQLGILPTEQSHPATKELSEWAKVDPDKAVKAMQAVDVEALRKVAARFSVAEEIHKACQETIEAGGRIFICGCGATGRLALSLEYLWRRQNPGSDKVVSFMAGGDVALVHSLEGFEDFPERGVKQLVELGFTKNDLLISSTEGGETPFVIGATEHAAATSKWKPFFLHCNPTEILKRNIERSRKVLESPNIRSHEIFVGPMALSGSTRMQASTALMLIIGLGLLSPADSGVKQELQSWISSFSELDLSFLKAFISKEAETYQEGHRTVYETDEFAITVFTDTTERAPTFNLSPFDNIHISQSDPSLSYVMIGKAFDATAAWETLLGRGPRALNWPEMSMKATRQYASGFDFSQKVLAFRERIAPKSEHRVFEIFRDKSDLVWRFQGVEKKIPLYSDFELFHHLKLKMLLNIHSTLLMGRLGRYEGNVMTWVYPSNGKLVDRAARYSIFLLERQGVKNIDYDKIVQIQFELKPTLHSKESIVIKTAERYLL